VALLAVALLGGAAQPGARPAKWAQPVVTSTFDNCFRVSDELYRSEQPARHDISALKALGIRSLINLRRFHPDAAAFEEHGLHLLAHPMTAGSASVADLVAVLRLFRSAEKPVLIHCWHGSDRTGFIVAGYRMVFQDWPRESAIEELRLGGFGFHEPTYRNIIKTLQELDVAAVKKAVFE
jgi:protein tyrosine/serine phosphatase